MVFALIFWLCALFFLVIVGTTIAFCIKYAKRRWTAPQPSPSHNLKLELLWTFIPTVLLLIVFYVSTSAYMTLTIPPEDEDLKEIHVTAQKWSWSFDYLDGETSNELHVVVDQPVLLTMSAEKVLHSLYIPAFRVKQDLVPGRYTKMWFRAVKPGTYPIYCAEYCGTNHSGMLSKVIVHPDQSSYAEWRSFLEELKTRPLHEIGEVLFTTKGCISCHTIDGQRSIGPSVKGIWGSTEVMSGGAAVRVDENYIRESIIKPKAKVLAGYPAVMPAAPLEEREFMAIIAYIKSLKE
jgi:cytochrome c oxidase subunit 2